MRYAPCALGATLSFVVVVAVEEINKNYNKN